MLLSSFSLSSLEESGKCVPQNLCFGWTYKLVGGYGETKLF